MRRLLARRDMRLYVAGQALSLFGDTSLWLALGIWAKTLTGSSGAAGLVIFALVAPQLAAPAAGVLVDRVRRRPLLIATNLATGAVVLALLAVHGRGQLWLIYAVAGLYGASYTVLGSGQSALLACLLPGAELAEANGLLQTLREGQRLIAPLAGAGLFSAVGGGAVAVLDAATFAVAAAALALMRVDEPAPVARDRDLVAGARHLLRTVALRQMVVACAVALAVMGFSETLVFAITDQGLHRPPSFVGVLMAVQGVGAVAGAMTAARVDRRLGEGVLAGLGMALVAAGALLTTGGSLAPVLAGTVVFGAGGPWVVVGAVTLLQRLTPGELQGRVYSAADLLLGAPQTASIAAGAALVAAVGYRELLVAEAAVFAIAGAYLLGAAPRSSGHQVLRGARELEDDGGLGLGRGGGALGLGDDGAHAVQ
jgi:MFS family permease